MAYHQLSHEQVANFVQAHQEFLLWVKLCKLVQELYGLQTGKVIVQYDTYRLADYDGMYIIQGVYDLKVYQPNGEEVEMDLNSPHIIQYFKKHANYYSGMTPQTADVDALTAARVAIKDQFIDYFPHLRNDTTFEKHPEETYDLEVPPGGHFPEIFIQRPDTIADRYVKHTTD
jgi:hypothetical protein